MIKWTSLKLKTFAFVKDCVKRTKEQATDWEKIVAIHNLTKDQYVEYINNS